MERHLSGQAIDFTVPLIDVSGEPITVTSVEWVMFDEQYDTVVTGTVTPSADDEVVTVSVEAQHCTITNNMKSEVRELKVSLVSDEKTIVTSTYFFLEEEVMCEPGTNSFVTFLEALRLMPEFPTFVALNSAPDEQKRSALIAAYRNIGSLELSTNALIDSTGLPMLTEQGESYWTTLQLTKEDWIVIQEDIKRNFQYAQMAEAEFLLGGDGNEDLRSKGVMSYTVGEVKQFFRTSKPLELSVSKHALKYIGRYVQYNRRLTRV